MKSIWNNEDNCRVYTCPVCKYEYREYYDYDNQNRNPGKPFIVMAEPILCEKTHSWSSPEIIRVKHYACPCCGMLQIDTSEL